MPLAKHCRCTRGQLQKVNVFEGDTYKIAGLLSIAWRRACTPIQSEWSTEEDARDAVYETVQHREHRGGGSHKFRLVD